jgi:hypothetical protein
VRNLGGKGSSTDEPREIVSEIRTLLTKQSKHTNNKIF